MGNAASGGGQASFDEFLYGIQQQESGGNYKAVNGGSGALGKYQIMPANVPGWSQKYMGTKWTPQQFLADPAKQDALASAVLRDYYTQWGPRGAASAWYSGNPALNMNYNSQNGGPSIGSYVDSVLGKSMGYPGTPGTAYGDPMPTPVTNVDNTVKGQATKADLPGSAGVGAVSAPGVDALTSPGTDAVNPPGSGTEIVQAQPTPTAAPGAAAAANDALSAGDPNASGAKYGLGKVLPFVASAAGEIGAKFGITSIGGYRSLQDGGYHPQGRALDMMTSDKANGDALAAYAWTNRARLGVTEIIYRQHILTVARANEGWRPMADRGSPTANHMDHVHLSFGK